MTKLEKIQKIAEKEMEKHGLTNLGWRFEFDRAYIRFGQCRHGHRAISLSKKLAEVNTIQRARMTILHEIAHALVGSHHNHNNVWKRKCLEIGGNGRSHYTSDDTKAVPPKYIGRCPNGHEVTSGRKRKVKSTCGKCHPVYNEKYLIIFEKA